jgi:hypothetical protein
MSHRGDHPGRAHRTVVRDRDRTNCDFSKKKQAFGVRLPGSVAAWQRGIHRGNDLPELNRAGARRRLRLRRFVLGTGTMPRRAKGLLINFVRVPLRGSVG